MGAAPGTAGLLLLVGLPASAADFAAGEGGGGSPAFVLQVRYDGAVDDGTCRLGPGDFEIEEGFADLLAGKGDDGDGGEFGADWGWGSGV